MNSQVSDHTNLLDEIDYWEMFKSKEDGKQ